MNRIIILSLVFIIGCEKNIESDYVNYDCDEVFSFYEQSVVQIMSDHCTGCHAESGASGGLALDNFNNTVDGIMNGSVIQRIKMDPSNPLFMPLGSEKLSQQQIDIIQNFSELLCQ